MTEALERSLRGCPVPPPLLSKVNFRVSLRVFLIFESPQKGDPTTPQGSLFQPLTTLTGTPSHPSKG